MKAKKDEEELRFAELSLFDRTIRRKGFKVVAGVDEAGRGPLAGPVVAAACILPNRNVFKGVNDSKQLTASQRSACYQSLVSHTGVKYGIGIVCSEEIDRINIYQATFQAMLKALAALASSLVPDYILVDGNVALSYEQIPSEAVVGGDGKSLAIAAASIIAKETRDRIMLDYHQTYPKYGFDRHKGYGTPCHLEALSLLGPTPIHRRSFAPLKLQSQKGIHEE
jgi:ribonuclease HII